MEKNTDNFLGNEEIPRKIMVIFFIVDTSGSMDGTKIGEVNSAIEETLSALKDISDSNPDAEVKLAILSFNSEVRWITPETGPVDPGLYVWRDLDAAGLTRMGAAFEELESKLHADKFMKSATSSYAPVMFLMSDGEPTETEEKFLSGLNKLKANKWFKAGIKVALGIGQDSDLDVLKAFTGTKEAVLQTDDYTKLKSMIQFVSVTSTEVASQSVSGGIKDDGSLKTKQEQVEEKIQEFAIDNTDGLDHDSDDEWEI